MTVQTKPDRGILLRSGPKIWDWTAYKSVRSGPIPVPQSGPVSLFVGIRRAHSVSIPIVALSLSGHCNGYRATVAVICNTEAEFTNLTPAVLSVQWLAQILTEYNAPQPIPLILFTDSANARTNVMNPYNKAHTQCIDIRYKWIIERVKEKAFEVQQISGQDMVVSQGELRD
jgi:hypothetical protein